MTGSLNYFSCTLGEAASRNVQKPPPWKTINSLIEHQARYNGQRPAVGFCSSSGRDDPWTHVVYTFKELRDKILEAVKVMKWRVNPYAKTVALLCSSGRDFLLVWLALIRMGLVVLLVAPELQTESVASLCQNSNATILFHDEKHSRLAQDAVAYLTKSAHEQYKAALIPKGSEIKPPPREHHLIFDHPSKSVYVHHTSGTSTGEPKPIYISNNGAVGALPMFDNKDNTGKATFTTTPLYHGGPADCFRAWTSASMIWLYPGVQDKPITADNVLRAMQVTRDYCDVHPEDVGQNHPEVKYFTAVPYVIESLAGISEGINLLKSMELVGVGGAALSDTLGDQLVAKEINLISRYGSAECGFIMSSRRNYQKDKKWQYLNKYQSPCLIFERQADGLAELVLKDWPFMAKRNRQDGSYATSDMFEAHPSGYGWRYHSRADSQLTLSTGKKFDPTPMENHVNAVGRIRGLLRDAYVFGTDRPYPGIFLFKYEDTDDIKDDKVIQQIWVAVEEENAKSPPHGRIPKHMLVAMPANSPLLKKTNKGTVLRRRVEEDFAVEIRKAYDRQSRNISEQKPLDDENIKANVFSIVRDKLPNDHRTKEEVWKSDLYDNGADSLAVMEIRDQLQRDYGHPLGFEFSIAFVYNCGSAEGIAEAIIQRRRGERAMQNDGWALMRHTVAEYDRKLIEKWGRSDDQQAGKLAKSNDYARWREDTDRLNEISPDEQVSQSSAATQELRSRSKSRIKQLPMPPEKMKVVVLTGVTGTLGVHIFNILRTYQPVKEIHCLIRAQDDKAAKQRLIQILAQRQLTNIHNSIATIHCHSCDISEKETLGLKPSVYQHLQNIATLIIHAAWAVNFALPLERFAKHGDGLSNLLGLAMGSKIKASPYFLFCSSTASVMGKHGPSHVGEEISYEAEYASDIGYAQSKWMAESFCDSVHQRTHLRGHIGVIRIGQLCGDTKNGIWNKTEAWPLMLAASKAIRALPALDEKLDWLRVDIAAQAVIEIAFSLTQNQKYASNSAKDSPCLVFHVLNSHTKPTWSEMLGWIMAIDPSIEIVEPAKWVGIVKESERIKPDHPARRLLPMWKEAYGDEAIMDGTKPKTFEMEKTLQAAPILDELEPIDEQFFRKLWVWVQNQSYE